MGRNNQLRDTPLSRLGEFGALPSWLEPSADPADPAVEQTADDGQPDNRGLFDDDQDVKPAPRHRMLPAPPAALALVVVGTLAVVVAAVLMIRNTPADIPDVAFPATAGPTSGRPAPGAPPSSTAATAPSGPLVISVVGLVHRPGLVRLPAQARVADAITAAGGARPGADLLSLNLARPLRDGDQIIVGLSGEGGRAALRSAVVGVDGQPAPTSAVPTPGGPASVPTAGGKVNLNTATEAELDALPGVGPVTAAAIIAWRTRNGRFSSVDQLGEVDGIGPGRLAKLRDRVTV